MSLIFKRKKERERKDDRVQRKPDGMSVPACSLADADRYLAAGEYRTAQDLYKQVISSRSGIAPRILQKYETVLMKDLDNVALKMSLAEMYLYLDDNNEAVYELQEVIELDPKHVDAYMQLARLYQKAGNTSDAVELYEKAYTYVDDDEIIDGLVSVYLRTGEYEKAIGVYTKAIRTREQNPSSIKILAELYTKNKQYEDAARTYLLLLKKDKTWSDEVADRVEQLKELAPENTFIKLALADTYLTAMKPDSAVHIYESLYKNDPKMLDESISRLKKVLALYPEYVPVLIALGYAFLQKQLYSEAVMYFTKLMKDNSRYLEEAINGYRQILEACPEQVLARQYLGEAYLMERRNDEAVQEFSQLIRYNGQEAGLVMTKCKTLLREDENYLPAHILLAQCHMVKDEHRKAYDICIAVLEKDTGIPTVYELLVELCFLLGEYGECRSYLHQLLEMNDMDIRFHELYATYAAKIFAAEIAELQSQEQNPQNSYLIGKKLYVVNRIEDAIKSLQTSSREPLYSAASYYYLGLCFKEEGRYDLAINQMKRAFELEKEQSNYMRMNTIKYHIGMAYESMGAIAEAIRQYEEIMQWDISFEKVKQRLDVLNSSSWIVFGGMSLLGVIREYGVKDFIVVWVPVHDATLDKQGKRETAKMDVSFSQSHNDMGVDYFLKGRIKAAEEEFMLALQLDQGFSIAHSNLGLLFLERMNCSEAQKSLDNAIRANERIAVNYANYGLLKYFSDDIDTAREYMEKAIMLNSSLWNAYLNLGDIYYRLGDLERAFHYWEGAYNNGTVPELARRRLMYRKTSFEVNEDFYII